jgi:hypothetical protein
MYIIKKGFLQILALDSLISERFLWGKLEGGRLGVYSVVECLSSNVQSSGFHPQPPKKMSGLRIILKSQTHIKKMHKLIDTKTLVSVNQ